MDSLEWRPTSKIKIVLLLISILSLILYFFPIHGKPPLIYPDAKWGYHYREVLIANGKAVYEINEILSYTTINVTNNILVVEISRFFEYKFFVNESQTILLNATESLFSFINIKNRLYSDGTYTSWWIPTDVSINSRIPIWNMEFHVKGLSWTIINGKLVECWVLEYKDYLEEYTLIYERITGLFIQFRVKTFIQPSQQIIRERWLIDADVKWPPLTIIRIPLLLVGIAASAAFLYSYVKRWLEKLMKIKLRPRREKHFPIIY